MAKAKTSKKANPKQAAKNEVRLAIETAINNMGLEVSKGEDYGFTKDTVVVHTETCDIQVKLVAPKAGIDRYELLEDDEDKGEGEE